MSTSAPHRYRESDIPEDDGSDSPSIFETARSRSRSPSRELVSPASTFRASPPRQPAPPPSEPVTLIRRLRRPGPGGSNGIPAQWLIAHKITGVRYKHSPSRVLVNFSVVVEYQVRWRTSAGIDADCTWVPMTRVMPRAAQLVDQFYQALRETDSTTVLTYKLTH